MNRCSAKLFSMEKRPCKISRRRLIPVLAAVGRKLFVPTEVFGEDAGAICGAKDWPKAREGTGAREEDVGSCGLKEEVSGSAGHPGARASGVCCFLIAAQVLHGR